MVLALIAFSGICWGTLTACGFCGVSWGFWEVFGICCALLLLVLALRPRGGWRQKLLGRAMMAQSGAVASFMPQPSRPQHDTAALDAASREACEDADTSWRGLYDQLSEDERQEFKALMEKYCGCSNKARLQDDERASDAAA